MKTRRSELGLLLGMGWSIAAWLVLGVLAGHWADGRFGIGPWGTLAGAATGITGAGVAVWRAVRGLESGPGKGTEEDSGGR